MKLWSVVILIVFVGSLSFGQLFDSVDDKTSNFMSEMLLQILSEINCTTVNLNMRSPNGLCESFASTFLSMYNGSVKINSKSFNKSDTVIMILDWHRTQSMTYDHLKGIRMLVLIACMTDTPHIRLLIPDSLTKSIITKIAFITMVQSDIPNIADINITFLERIKTRNCEILNTNIIPLNQTLSYGSTIINSSVGHLSKNFQGCSMDVGIVLLAPFTVLSRKHGSAKYSGLEVDLLKVIANYFNFKIRFTPPPNGMQWGELRENGSTGLMGMIQNENVDFAVGSIGRSLARNTMLQAGVGNFYDQGIFAVPPGIPYTPMEKLTMPATTNTWVFVMVSFIIFSLLFSIDINEQFLRIQFDKRETLFTYAWSILMGGVMHKTPVSFFKRYLLIGWLTGTLILRNAYQAILFNNLRRGIEFEPFLTPAEIDKAGLYYYMYNISQRFFIRNPHILKRSVIVKDNISLPGVLENIADNKLKAAFPLPKSNVAFFNKQRVFRSKVHVTQYVIETYEVAIHYPKGSPLAELFGAVISRVRAGGLHEYWIRQYQGPKQEPSKEPKQLSVHSLMGVFTIYAILCACSCISFITEMIAGKNKRLI
ncbi:uncharacterized protein LOC110678134 [Aedes aegypti]|uniref:Ionotropic glutamate receptor L-glutamate and glycine-binding domain-containing protein n=1 Tax=Aedes aegypti TaxID=7159 RepID=A0A6I8U558_AEDAE|nr:ionotropic receptor 7r precursor [Aedes aegypti]